ncbi:MAG: hypothetical protein Q8Q39_04940 [bacterium]|nr:hypothetical protein [bacterium]
MEPHANKPNQQTDTLTDRNRTAIAEQELSRTLANLVESIEYFYDDDFSSIDTRLSHEEALRIARYLLEEWTLKLTGYDLADYLGRIRKSRNHSPSLEWYRGVGW